MENFDFLNYDSEEEIQKYKDNTITELQRLLIEAKKSEIQVCKENPRLITIFGKEAQSRIFALIKRFNDNARFIA